MPTQSAATPDTVAAKRSHEGTTKGEDSSDASSSDEDEPETAVVVYDPGKLVAATPPAAPPPALLPPADGAGPSTSRAATPELEHAAGPNFVGDRFFLNKLSSNAAAEADRIAQSSPLRPGMQATVRPEELRPTQLIALAQAVHERV